MFRKRKAERPYDPNAGSAGEKMVQFYGCCVTRDIAESLDTCTVNQAVQFSSLMAQFSKPLRVRLLQADFPPGDQSEFEMRNLCIDVNKTAFAYLNERKSDYFLCDLGDCRADLLCADDSFVTLLAGAKGYKDFLQDKLGLAEWQEKRCYEFSLNQWTEVVHKFADAVLENYTPDKIIVNECYGVGSYIRNGCFLELHPDSKYGGLHIEKANFLLERLYVILEERLGAECHVIPFPHNVYASDQHHFGLYYMHYEPLYYEYGKRALDIIFSGIREKERLNELLKVYRRKIDESHERIRQKYLDSKLDKLAFLFLEQKMGIDEADYMKCLLKPKQIDAVATETTVKISFERHESADKYYIYLDGKYKGCTLTLDQYTVKDLIPGTTYKVSVKAVKEMDGKTIYSLMSPTVSITTKKES